MTFFSDLGLVGKKKEDTPYCTAVSSKAAGGWKKRQKSHPCPLALTLQGFWGRDVPAGESVFRRRE